MRNLSGQVEILAQGPIPALQRFTRSLLDEAPSLARPTLLSVDVGSTLPAFGSSTSVASDATVPSDIHLPPDQFTCDDCLRELGDPRDRRFRYPFINCTQCGPRYTLITALPYDRANTTMAGFAALRRAAPAEYANPPDRRFHAEPIACSDCGPRLRFVIAHRPWAAKDDAAAGGAAIAALRQGAVLAVKGIGGYHLVCDAFNSGRHRRPASAQVPPAQAAGGDVAVD